MMCPIILVANIVIVVVLVSTRIALISTRTTDYYLGRYVHSKVGATWGGRRSRPAVRNDALPGNGADGGCWLWAGR